MAEVEDRDKTENDLLLALLALFALHTEQDESFEDELKQLLYFWLGFLYVQSAVQHGAESLAAEEAAFGWIVGHVNRVVLRMRDHSQRLLEAGKPVFTLDRAERMASTEVTQAAVSGAEFAARVLGYASENDLWITRPEASATGVCPYCLPLHRKPRREWFQVYTNIILPTYPAFAAYGPPAHPPAHVSCNCFIWYVNRDGDPDA